MHKLMKTKLFGGGLLDVSSSELVRRYNKCLNQMGIEETKLEKFRIDGIGWSPEIAQERRDNYYLSHGIANQLVIIISPEQRGKPIYFPFHSFDRFLMKDFFKNHIKAITDITTTTFIWLDIDQEISSFKRPNDLLLVKNIVVRSTADNLIKASREQKELIKIFLDGENNWSNEKLREKIIESAKQNGDLRYRSVDIPDTRFELASFYTKAFGGVFVFQFKKNKKILIMEDKTELEKLNYTQENLCCLDQNVINLLREEKMIEIDLYRKDTLEFLSYHMECVLANAICLENEKIEFTTLTSAQKKGLINKLGDKIPEIFFELERLFIKVETKSHPDVKELPEDLKLLLWRPVEHASEQVNRLLLHLLSKFNSYNVVNFYRFNKDTFFKTYATWPQSKKDWAIDMILRKYKPKNIIDLKGENDGDSE